MSFARIRPKRGTRTQWATANTVLAEGEWGIEVPNEGVGTGLIKIKIGDGSTTWNNLPYAFDYASMVQKEEVVKSATITEYGKIMDGKIASDKMAYLDGKFKSKNFVITKNVPSNANVVIDEDVTMTGYTAIIVSDIGLSTTWVQCSGGWISSEMDGGQKQVINHVKSNIRNLGNSIDVNLNFTVLYVKS